MKHILVIADPCEDEQLAFEKGLEFAIKSGAHLHILVLCYESLKDFDHLEIKVSTKPGESDNIDNGNRIKDKILEHRNKWWQDFIKTVDLDEIVVTFEIIWEKYLHNAVLAHCENKQYDLIFKTGHRSETAFHTPADWHLFRESRIPIYLIAAESYKQTKTVLVTLDMKTKDEQKRKLNNKLLEIAFRLAIQIDAQIHCIYVIKIPTIVSDLELIDVGKHVQHIKNEVMPEILSLVDDYDIEDKNIHIHAGEPSKFIPRTANALKAECVVIGSMGKTGIAGKLIGNTAEQVIKNLHSDVLVASPDDQSS